MKKSANEKNESVNYGKRKCKSSACRSVRVRVSFIYPFILFFFSNSRLHTHDRVCDANFGMLHRRIKSERACVRMYICVCVCIIRMFARIIVHF